MRGGYGEQITDYVQKRYKEIEVLNIALPDAMWSMEMFLFCEAIWELTVIPS